MPFPESVRNSRESSSFLGLGSYLVRSRNIYEDTTGSGRAEVISEHGLDSCNPHAGMLKASARLNTRSHEILHLSFLRRSICCNGSPVLRIKAILEMTAMQLQARLWYLKSSFLLSRRSKNFQIYISCQVKWVTAMASAFCGKEWMSDQKHIRRRERRDQDLDSF